MDKQELIEQTRNSFDFLQKLYLEVSYLIKEIEGQLNKLGKEERISRIPPRSVIAIV